MRKDKIMEKIYDVKTAVTEVEKSIGRKLECPEKDFTVCLGLIKEKYDLRRQIRQLEEKIEAKQQEITQSNMSWHYGMEYACLLSTVYNWMEQNDNETLG
jgi:hypothetical protein